MGLLDFVRSIAASMYASAAVGRGFRLRNSGDMQGALAQAHKGLELLRAPYVRRGNATEGSALISLTILAEQAATELRVPGASTNDLVDAIALLNSLKGEGQPDSCLFIPFLKTRLESLPPAP